MNTEPTVSRAKTGSHSKGLKRAFNYVASKEAFPKVAKTVGFSAAAVGAVIVAVSGPSSDDTKPKATDVPSLSGSPANVSPNLDAYSREADARSFDPTIPRKPKDKSHVSLLGPQLVLRSSKLKIQQGTIVKATLLSGASDGVVKAKFSQLLDSEQNQESPFENGTIFIGRGSTSGDRLRILFDRAILPDGQANSIQGEALDPSDRIAGLKGSKLGEGALKLATGIGLNFLSGVSEGLQDSHGQQGVAAKDPSLKNALLQGTARASLTQSQEIVADLHSSKPAIAVPSGNEILIVFSEGGSQ